MKITRCLIILCIALSLTSCKLRIVVPEGGSVTTQSGAYNCAAGKTCTIDVVDFYFDQTFVAKPADGYKFKFWRKADRRFCGGKSIPCHLTTIGTNANTNLAEVMISFFESNTEMFYLQPVFERVQGSTLSISGTWNGTAGDSSGAGQMSWKLTQSGENFSGSMETIDSSTRMRITGNLIGTISDSTFNFNLTIPRGGFHSPGWEQCSATASGSGYLSVASLTGSFSGSNSCTGAFSSGTFTLVKQ